MVVVATGMTTLGLAFYAATHLGINSDNTAMVGEDLASRRNHEAFAALFPNLEHALLIVVEGETPELARDAADGLTAGLRSRPDSFTDAYIPGGGSFFERAGLLYRSVAELEEFADQMARVQPLLAELERDSSIANFTALIQQGLDAIGDESDEADQWVKVLDQIGQATVEVYNEYPLAVSWQDMLVQGSSLETRNRRVIVAHPVLDFESVFAAAHPMKIIHQLSDDLGYTAEHGVSVRITGNLALNYEEMIGIGWDVGGAGVFCFALVVGILVIALRSLKLVSAAVIALLSGLIWTLAFAAFSIGYLNLVSVTFAVLFIGLGVDFGIHICIRYRELLAGGRGHEDALAETARDVGSSIFLCAVTTAIGFFAFVPTDFLGVAELGLISGAGMFVSLFCTLTLLPALMSLPPVPAGRGVVGTIVWSGGGLVSLPIRHPRAVRSAALLMGLGAMVLLPRARFDNNPLNVRDPSSESVRTFNELLEKGSSSPWTLNAVAPSLESAELLAERLRGLDVVERVVTVADYVPSDQEQKLGIIEDVAMFLAPPPGPDGRVPPPELAEQIAELEVLDREVERLLDESTDASFVTSASKLHVALSGYLDRVASSQDAAAEIAALEDSLLGTLPEQLRTLNAALAAGHVTLEKLPEAILERMITADGRVRIQIYPSEDLNDHAALAAFVENVQTITPEVAGSASEILASGRAVVTALTEAMVSAFIVITAFLLLLWRRIDDTALVLIPLLLAAALTVAAAVLLDIPFNFADVIVLPLLLGIGVDSGIHLVHRARAGNPGDSNLLGTSTARAVAFSAMTTIASFGSLGFATHLGMATLGQLLTLGVGFTIVCNLIVLPSLIPLRPQRPKHVDSAERAA